MMYAATLGVSNNIGGMGREGCLDQAVFLVGRSGKNRVLKSSIEYFVTKVITTVSHQMCVFKSSLVARDNNVQCNDQTHYLTKDTISHMI